MMNFAATANELRQKEILRLSDALTPRIEALRSMTVQAFRATIAVMLHSFGHEIIGHPEAPELVTGKAGKKFITACASPADLVPVKIPALRRLHDAVVAANAERGFYITVRAFDPQAETYAESAPLDLFDGKRLIKALQQSRKGVLMPQTYKAMCHQCGEIVQHRLDREQDEARPCGNGHLVAPTIARAMLLPPRLPATGNGASAAPTPAPRPLSRREIRAHNAKYEARMMKKTRGPSGGIAT
jgi:Restriction endonuclease